MATGTAGAGNDKIKNACGIAQSHAFTLITAFTWTYPNGTN